MKAVILAGGLGTRISEETHLKPKPMVEIGGKPIIWHIMKALSCYKINDFIICCGYKGYSLKEYFNNYLIHTSDVTFDFVNKKTQFHNKDRDPWKVTLIDTGESTMTGGRLKNVKEYLDNEKPFLFTYGDGVSNININSLIEFHKKNKKKVTLTAVNPPGRFGSLIFKKDNKTVQVFSEKTDGGNTWINGGFFIVERNVVDLIDDRSVIWETSILSKLAENNDLAGYQHKGFWAPMDTLRDKRELNKMWNEDKAPWKIW